MRIFLNGIKLVMIGLVVLCLAGCASSRELSYISQAKTIKPVAMPSGLTRAKIKAYYPIPPVASARSGAVQPSLLPPGSGLTTVKKSQSKGVDQ